MIIIKNSQLTNDTVQSINLLLDLNLPIKVAFKLARIIKEISSLIDDKLKLERKILDRYVEKDQNGNPLPGVDENNNPIPNTFKIADIPNFNSEMEELNAIETELPFEKLQIEDLNISSIKVRDLMKLEFLFNL